MDDGEVPGRLLIIGGAEDRCCGSGVLERFAQLCGGAKARIVVITTATGMPGQVLAEYEQVFRKLGVRHVKELPISGRADADSARAADSLNGATGVFLAKTRPGCRRWSDRGSTTCSPRVSRPAWLSRAPARAPRP